MEFESELKIRFEKIISGAPERLVESIRYSLFAPGKRIRPRLVFATSEMIGLDLYAAHAAASALELIHCFTLIHDDLPCMDDDDFRRGRPSNHKQFGEAIALLSGDALMVMAWDALLLARDKVPPENLLNAFHTLSHATGPLGVIGGQAAELELAKKGSTATLTHLEQVHAAKTGALFSAALLLPMDLAGISTETPKGGCIKKFAASLGLAFQVADDLEDSFENHQKPDPTHILFFQSRDEASRNSILRLDSSCEELNKNWGDLATPLIQIASEVKRKL